jgi:glycosyltransferase involved in cell wall biosynthesis
MKYEKICLTPRVSGVGGMVSFRNKLKKGLEKRGVLVTEDLNDRPYDAVLVIGGTRQIQALWHTRQAGIPIIQRLDGMNWIHRKRYTGLRHFLRSEYGNWLLAFIRRRLATHIVYQSQFVVKWWEQRYPQIAAPYTVIHNGVDLNMYTPCGEHKRPEDVFHILLVEGALGGGYEIGLESAVQLTALLTQKYNLPVELVVVGKVMPHVKAKMNKKTSIPIHWAGLVPQHQIPYIDRSAHLLYSADLNAACPNSVIEALACGLPVAAFDTGALAELVTGDSGKIVPYGGNPWNLDPPDIPSLAEAAIEVLENQPLFRKTARERAQEAFSLDEMVEAYFKVLLES